MWRDDLRLIADILRIMLRRATCRCRYGVLVLNGDWIGIECTRCRAVSPGIVLEGTGAIRLAWRHDRQRARFQKAS